MDYPACIIHSINGLKNQDTKDTPSESTSQKAPQKITQWHSITNCPKLTSKQEREKE